MPATVTTMNAPSKRLRNVVKEIKIIRNPVVKIYPPNTQKTFSNQCNSPGILSFIFFNVEPIYTRSSGNIVGRIKIKYKPMPIRIRPVSPSTVAEYGFKLKWLISYC